MSMVGKGSLALLGGDAASAGGSLALLGGDAASAGGSLGFSPAMQAHPGLWPTACTDKHVQVRES
jgi:hypothetical protein